VAAVRIITHLMTKTVWPSEAKCKFVPVHS